MKRKQALLESNLPRDSPAEAHRNDVTGAEGYWLLRPTQISDDRPPDASKTRLAMLGDMTDRLRPGTPSPSQSLGRHVLSLSNPDNCLGHKARILQERETET